MCVRASCSKAYRDKLIRYKWLVAVEVQHAPDPYIILWKEMDQKVLGILQRYAGKTPRPCVFIVTLYESVK